MSEILVREIMMNSYTDELKAAQNPKKSKRWKIVQQATPQTSPRT
jgi:hypothetical protein